MTIPVESKLPAWCADLARLDDETLAAWSSVGNLRRAARELESGTIALAADHPVVLVRVDDALCTLTDADLAHAGCSCPASTACRHLLAAILWLRRQTLPLEDSKPPSGSGGAFQRLCGLDPESVLQKLTPTQRRKAIEMAEDSSWIVHAGAASSVGIEHSRKGWECRWTPDERIGTMVSNVPSAQSAIAHAAAVLSVLRERGLRLAPAPPEAIAVALPADLPSLLRQLLSRGLSHAGDHFPTRLDVLATQVRALGRKSLASRMRTLAAQLGRVGPSGVTTQEALHAVAMVLGEIESTNAPEAQEVRQIPQTEAICLGAHWWESPGGARGATVLFAELASGALRTLPLARADLRDVFFSRDSLWDTQKIWKGACLDTLQEKRLRLGSVCARSDGSWKSSEATSVATSPWPKSDDALWKPLGEFRWAGVGETLCGLSGSAEVERVHVLLRPAQLGEFFVVESEQEVRWEVFDSDGQVLTLHLGEESWKDQRTDALIGWLHQHSDRVRAVAAVARRSDLRIVLEPTCLLFDLEGEMVAWSPDFQPPPRIHASVISRWFQKLQNKQPRTRESLPVRVVQEPPTPARIALGPVVELCERWSEAGSVGRPTSEETQQVAKALDHRGFAQLAQRVARLHLVQDDLEAVRVHRMCRVLLELDEWSQTDHQQEVPDV